MPALSAIQASDLASQFLALAQAIGDFRYTHWNELSKAQHQRLASQHWSVLNYGEDMLALSTTLVMNDTVRSLDTIRSVVGAVKSKLKAVTDLQKGIDISADIITLGAAIISVNPPAIGKAIDGLINDF